MANLNSLGKLLKKDLAKVEKIASEKCKRAARVLVRSLVVNTPVDTSRALSNWIVGVGMPDPSYITPWVPGKAGSTKGESGALAAKMADLMIRDKKPGTPLYVTNNAPYIVKLNKRPVGDYNGGGFLELALTAARTELKK